MTDEEENNITTLMVLMHQMVENLPLDKTVTVLRKVLCPYHRALVASALSMPTPSMCSAHEHEEVEEEMFREPDYAENSVYVLGVKEEEGTLQ